jgi:hypothetical protein
VHAAEGVDRVRDVGVGVRRRERKREHFGARPLGDRERRLVRKALAVVRERVYREEVDARADVLLGQRARASGMMPGSSSTAAS